MWYNKAMDGQEYLNQISAKTQPKTNKNRGGIIGSKFFLIGAIGIGVLFLILIVGIALTGTGDGAKNKVFRLLAHLDNTTSMVAEYQPNIRSSELRSNSASLYSVLSNTSSEVLEYATEKYNIKAIKDVSKNIPEQAKTEQDALNEELFKAKINGILDRVYANKMAYEISIIKTQENDLRDTTKDDILKEALDKSYNSLENLYDKFNNFSEAR